MADVRVAALYQFTRFDDPAAIRGPLLALCVAQGVKGTLLLAREGINGTIAGSNAAIDAVLAHIRALPGCAEIDVKFSHAAAMPFHRMKVRLKREFPDWFRAKRAEIEAEGRTPKIAMFCTGGIRCEKSTAFAKAEGVEQVYHLKGGILAYLEAVPQDRSLWDGECFVFDERVAVKHGLEVGDHVLCRACRMPVSPEARESSDYVEGVSCPACVGTRTEEQRASYAERHRQALLAQGRGEAHVGAVFGEREPD